MPHCLQVLLPLLDDQLKGCFLSKEAFLLVLHLVEQVTLGNGGVRSLKGLPGIVDSSTGRQIDILPD